MYNLILDAILLSSRNISSMNIASVVQKKLKFQKKLIIEGVRLYLRSSDGDFGKEGTSLPIAARIRNLHHLKPSSPMSTKISFFFQKN